MEKVSWREVSLGKLVAMGANAGRRWYMDVGGEQRIISYRSSSEDPMLVADDQRLERLRERGVHALSERDHSRFLG